MAALPVTFEFLPKADSQSTLLEVGKGISSCNLIRIKNGRVQKLGGCAKLLTSLYGAQGNALLAWAPIIPNNYNVTVFSYVSGTGVVTIHALGASVSVGQPFRVTGLTGTGSIALANVTSVTGPGSGGNVITYTIATGLTLSWNGTSGTVTNSAGLSPFFLIALGSVGGLEVNTGSGVSTSITPTTWTGDGNWTLALWGTWLLAYSEEQPIFYWIPDFPLTGPALPISGLPGATGTPLQARGGFVAGPQQQAFAWGVFSSTLGAEDPLEIAWCDVANLQDWTATATNQAGSFHLSSGSVIVDGTWFGQIGLIWTDIEFWGILYVGFPLVYAFNRISQNCGLIAPQAWASIGTMIAWMSPNDFFSYQGGSVSPIPCSVRDFVFNNIDRGHLHSVHCDANSFFNEFKWSFPMVGSAGVSNAWVKWTPGENNAWDFGMEPVGANYPSDILNSWCDQGSSGGTLAEPTNHPPLGVDYSGNILAFEFSGSTFLTNWDGAALDSFVVSGWFYIAEGQEMVTVERVNPDFIWSPQPGGTPSGTVTMTFYFADEVPVNQSDYPVRIYGPNVVTPTTPYIIVRGRGRVMRVRIDCQDANTFWRSGKHLMRAFVDGRR